MNEKDFFDYGGKILNSVNKAAEDGDFSNLSFNVKSLIGEAARGFAEGAGLYKSPGANQASASYNFGSEMRDTIESGIKSVFPWKSGVQTPFFSVRIKKHKGIGKIIGGSFIDFIGFIVLIGHSVTSDIVFACVSLALGTLLIIAGKNNRSVIKDYFKFGKIIGDKSYITVSELADKSGMKPEKIVSQLKQMKKLDYLPYATMDKAETTLMLTDEVYKEYLKSAAYNARLKGNAAKKHKANGKQKDAAQETQQAATQEQSEPYMVQYYTIDENLPSDVKTILKEGNDYLNKIRYYNDLIPDTETMSDKLYTLEATVLSIFKRLMEEPKVAGDLRRFMSYYLPTTEKLLQSYVDLRKQSQSIENIANSQKEIEEATDVINDAFVKFLNQLFESTSWDISADITVLKTQMKQDALL